MVRKRKDVRGLIIFLFSFSLGVFSQETSQEKIDSTSALSSEHKEEIIDTTKVNTSNFKILPYYEADSIITKLISKGFEIKKNRIISAGIVDSSDSHQYLQIIFLDENNQQARKNFLLDSLEKPTSNEEIAVESSSLKEKDQKTNTITYPPKLRQDGRVYFMINCALKSISVYSMGLNLAFPQIYMTTPQVLTGISFLSLGASLYGSYIFTKNMEMGYGRVEFMNYGGDLGVTYPTLIAILLRNVGEFKYPERVQGWGQMLLFPAGIFAGSKVKFAGNFEYGNASVMTSLSKFGVMYGFALPWIFSPPTKNEKKYLNYSTSLSMVFIPTGFYVGKILVDRYGPISSGRSVFITTGGVMGALSGLLIPTLWDEKQEEVYPITTIIGHIGGTFFGFNYMRNRSYTFGQGMFMIASAVVGTAVAEAFPLIAKVENNHKPYVIFGLIGGWGGLIGGEALARSLFEKSSRDDSKAERYSVKLAGIYQLPLLWAYSKNKSINKELEIRTSLIELNF